MCSRAVCRAHPAAGLRTSLRQMVSYVNAFITEYATLAEA